MAISTSINFSVTRDSIIKKALQLLGVLSEGEDPNSDQITDMSISLNSLIKAWQAEQLNLFAVSRLYLFPKKNQHEYQVGTGASDHITSAFRETTISTESSGTTINLSEDKSPVVGDYIGVQVDGTTVEWSQITAVTSSTEVEIDSALSEAAEAGNSVFLYSTKANRPMRILESYTRLGDVDIPNKVLARRDYNMLGVKGADGIPNQIYFDPQINTANIFVYPEPSDETNYLTLFVQRTLADLDSASDNPELPQEWYLPLAYNLAWVTMAEYGIPQMDGSRIEKLARYWYDVASDFDMEQDTSLYLMPDTLESL